MKKREFCYLQHPAVYDIAPCNCGSGNYTWSEYEDHLWCFTCEIDFKPKHWGIFDGPIPFNLSNLLGIHFYRVELKSGEYFAPNLNLNYHKVLNFDKFIELDLDLIFEFELLHSNYEKETESFTTTLYYDEKGLHFSSNQKLEDGTYTSKITTYSKDIGFKDWILSFTSNNNSLSLNENEETETLKIILMKNYLNLILKKKETISSNKI